jgi:Icc-related predicted phosphoesterase
MPRLHILSDIQAEFEAYRGADVSADVVVLAGDINHGVKGLEWARGSFPNSPIIYVAGNHEYYGEAIPKLTDQLRSRARSLDIAFLENEETHICGVRFLGCTLWSDLQLFGNAPWVVDAVRDAMIDYRSIRVSPEYRRIRPLDTIRWHRESVSWLAKAATSADPTVVVTHHAPNARSIAPKYAEDPVSAAYASDLTHLIEQLAPALWVHGHTHYSIDYEVGRTRVVSNQRGYSDGEDVRFDPELVIELSPDLGP